MLDEIELLDTLVSRHAYYEEHLREALETLQRAISGDIPGVSFDDFIERGVLDPARYWLTQAPSEDIRLSVLIAEGPAKRDFVMRFAAGHSLEGQKISASRWFGS